MCLKNLVVNVNGWLHSDRSYNVCMNLIHLINHHYLNVFYVMHSRLHDNQLLGRILFYSSPSFNYLFFGLLHIFNYIGFLWLTYNENVYAVQKFIFSKNQNNSLKQSLRSIILLYLLKLWIYAWKQCVKAL